MKISQKILGALAGVVIAFIFYTIPVHAQVYQYNPYGYGQNNYYYNAPISLSATNITLYPGQNQIITIYGQGLSFYISNNSNPNSAIPSVNGNTVTVTALNPGSSSLVICYQNSNANCATLTVTVTSPYQSVVPQYTIPPTAYVSLPTTPSSIYLSQVPYTGAGSNLTVGLFIAALTLWTAGLSYFLVRRRARAYGKI